jgi:hypothetical protein
MITLTRDGKVMEVATELQASVFLRYGYTRVDEAPAENTPERNFATEEAKVETAPNAEPEPEMPVSEDAPKRRRRGAK